MYVPKRLLWGKESWEWERESEESDGDLRSVGQERRDRRRRHSCIGATECLVHFP